jgi:hypothetical protein
MVFHVSAILGSSYSCGTTGTFKPFVNLLEEAIVVFFLLNAKSTVTMQLEIHDKDVQT